MSLNGRSWGRRFWDSPVSGSPPKEGSLAHSLESMNCPVLGILILHVLSAEDQWLCLGASLGLLYGMRLRIQPPREYSEKRTE